MYLSILRVKLADMPHDFFFKEKRKKKCISCVYVNLKVRRQPAGTDSLYHMGSGDEIGAIRLVVMPSLNECSPRHKLTNGVV